MGVVLRLCFAFICVPVRTGPARTDMRNGGAHEGNGYEQDRDFFYHRAGPELRHGGGAAAAARSRSRVQLK